MIRLIFVVISVLLVSASNAQTRTRTFVDWTMGTQTAEEGLFAATTNDSGNILGKYCFATLDGCMYLLAMKTSCEQGNKYPVLVNANTGSQTLEVYCNGLLGRYNLYQYVFTEFDKIEDTVLRANRVGFAVPLQSDQFNVIRFSLMGSNEAIEAMTQAYGRGAARGGLGGRSSTRDQRL
jgi:hypothetical protein